MTRRFRNKILYLILSLLFSGGVVFVFKKNINFIIQEFQDIQNEKSEISRTYYDLKNLEFFYDKTLPRHETYVKKGVFLDPRPEAFKHQLRHALENYNTQAFVSFHDPFYDHIQDGFDIKYLPATITFKVYNQDTVFQMIHAINHQMSYFISPVQLIVQQVKDRYFVTYKVLWIKGSLYGELSNLSVSKSPWHFVE